ncbi:MAG: efflux RND transporter permease subunit [Pseudomonadota bacterium]
MTPAEWCIRKPVATAMIFLSCLVLGGLSSRLLPLELFPSIDLPILFIDMPYPGSTPREVERSIVRPAEEALATLKGTQFINSSSYADQGQVILAFDWREDLGIKAVEARERLDAIRDELPDDLRRVNVYKFNTSDQAVLTLRISSERDLSESYELLTRNLVRPVERLPGVARVELQGVEPKEIRIELDADLVEAQGVSLIELNRLLQQSNFAASAGLISDGDLRYRVNPIGEYRTIEEIGRLVIDQDGTRLSDIATIRFEPRERTYSRHLDQKYAVGLEIYKERGANLVDVAERAVAAVEEAGESREMQGIRLFFLEDQAEGVKSSLRELLNAGLLGAVLSLVVLYFFLRNWSTTLMVSLAVPISITVTLGIMYLTGYSLNILSMMGLMLAVGMLVDNAVVISESIFTEREKSPGDPVGASVRGVRAVGLAVLAGTLTSMAVFLPNLFGEMDQVKIFLQHVAAAICISLAMSLVISQTLIPLVASRVKPPSGDRKTQGIDRFKDRYARFLDWTLRHRWWAWGGIVGILLSWAIPLNIVKTDMFPETFDRELFLPYYLDANYPLETIEPAVDEIEQFLYDNKERFDIDKVYTYYDEFGNAQSTILLVDKEEATLSAKAAKEMIEAELPKIAIGQPSFEEQRSAGAEGVTLSLIGDSSERLANMVDGVILALENVDGLQDIRSSIGAGNQEVAVSVDRERARSYGFSSQEVAQAIAVALRGTQLDEFRGPEGEIPMTLRFQDADSQTVEQLEGLRLSTADGRRIPLLALVDVNVRPGPYNISRADRETALRLSANLTDGATMDSVREDISAVMDAIEFPPGYGWKYGRGFEFQDDTAQNMIRNILLAVLFIYLIMAALFESLVHPLSILTGIMFSVVGVHWFFLLTGTTFSLMAFIGILILIGVVVNNGIVMVDHINQLRRSGLLRSEAVVQAGRDRIRPILMTVGTTVLGLLPLCIGTTQIGGDGPPYFPMARAIVGGLVFSTVISLCVLPTIYVTLDDLRIWGGNRVRRARERLGRRTAPLAS